MRAKPRKKSDTVKTGTSRQSKYYYMERTPLSEKVRKFAFMPLFGVRHPNEKGELSEYVKNQGDKM